MVVTYNIDVFYWCVFSSLKNHHKKLSNILINPMKTGHLIILLTEKMGVFVAMLMILLLLQHTLIMQYWLENYLKKYNIIAEFMINNRLKLNDDKTHLLVISTGQARIRSQSCNLVEIRTPTENIKPSFNEKLLGCWVQNDLKWSDHLRDNDESLVRALTTRLSALKKVARFTSFKN